MAGKTTIESLEGFVWGEPSFESFLNTRIYALRKKPLNEFELEDLRLMIGQCIGLEHLMPLALERLQQSVLCPGDFYEGDLLAAVSRVPRAFWQRHPDMGAIFDRLAMRPEARRLVRLNPPAEGPLPDAASQYHEWQAYAKKGMRRRGPRR